MYYTILYYTDWIRHMGPCRLIFTKGEQHLSDTCTFFGSTGCVPHILGNENAPSSPFRTADASIPRQVSVSGIQDPEPLLRWATRLPRNMATKSTCYMVTWLHGRNWSSTAWWPHKRAGNWWVGFLCRLYLFNCSPFNLAEILTSFYSR